MLKFELNFILQFVSYKVIMSRNMFLDYSPLFMSSYEILYQSSCAYTPQQNGVAKCKNCHLVETVRTLILHHKVPQRFCGDATLVACYLINRMPSSVLHDKIPHSIILPNQPLFFLPSRVCGCICFVHILTPGQDKLSAKATECVFLSYSQLQRGYRCYSLDTHRYFVFADVAFFENSSMLPINYPPNSDVISLPLLYLRPGYLTVPPATPLRPLQVYTCHPRTNNEPLADLSLVAPSSTTSVLLSPTDLPIAIHKGTRFSRNPHPIYNFLTYHRLSSPYSAFVSTLSYVFVPQTVHEAICHPD